MFQSFYLPILIFLPLMIAGLIILPVLKNPITIRKTVSIFSLIEVVISILEYFLYSPNNNSLCKTVCDFSFFNETLNNLGINLRFGLDTLSVLMIILTTILFYLSITISKLFIKHHHKLFYSLLLILETILLAIFTVKDMFIFFVLWELELVPMYFLISLWGNKKSKQAGLKFVLYTFGGSLFLLLGFLFIYYTNFAISGVMNTDITQLKMNNINPILQILITFLLLIGFGVKIPIVPLHRWLADTHTNSTTPISMILAGILLKLGIYGIIRFNIGIVPLGFTFISPILGLLAIVNIIYGATLAYSQTNIKRIVAYSSISQMGIILLGLASLTPTGYIGSVFHTLSHGFLAAGMFAIVGIIKQKFGTGSINRLSGIACVTPKLYGLSMIILLGSVGIPFLSGFIGEFLTIYGAISSSVIIIKLFGVIAFCVLILTALYVLKLIHNVFMGLLPEKYNKVQDVAIHEFTVLGVICFIAIILGCFPFIVVNFLS